VFEEFSEEHGFHQAVHWHDSGESIHEGRERKGQVDEVASESHLWTTRWVGLKVLKKRLSEYVRVVAAGEKVLVMDRDKVVADFGPPRPGRSAVQVDARLAEAMRQGWVSAPRLAGQEPPPRRPVCAVPKPG
jgi:antitoxin (DNA-binding transcriptional repressor) of toxin-antitoxin stability system